MVGHNGLWGTRTPTLLEYGGVRDAAPSWLGGLLGPLSYSLEVEPSIHDAAVRAPIS